MEGILTPKNLLDKKYNNSKQRVPIAVAYNRVSDPRQIEGESLEVQKHTIQQYANSRSICIQKWFSDEGKSAKTVKKRPGMMSLIEYCQQHRGEIGYVIVYKYQRASRNVAAYYTDFDSVMRGLGIEVVSATEESANGSSSQEELMKVINLAVAQIDNETKSNIVKDVMESIARKGYWQTNPPIGYTIAKVKSTEGKKRSVLVKDGVKAVLVKELLEHYANSNCNQADLKRLAKIKGLKNNKGGSLDDDAIKRMLTQPAYAGYVCNKHTDFEFCEGQHMQDALITTETFNKIQMKLNGSPTTRVDIKTDKDNPLYPLGKFIKCPNCGRNFYYSAPKTGAGGHSARYHCTRDCCKGIIPSIKAEELNDLFAELLGDIQPEQEVLELYKLILNRVALNQLDATNTQIRTLNSQYEKLEDERLQTLRNYNAGKLAEKEKDCIMRAVDSEILELSAELNQLKDERSVKKVQIDYALNFMGNIKKMWIDADLDTKRKIQIMVFPDGLSFDTRTKKFGTINTSPLYRYIPTKKASEDAPNSHMVISAGVEPALTG